MKTMVPTRKGIPNIPTRVHPVATAIGAIFFLSSLAAAQGGPGFLFEQPRASVGARIGYAVPSLDSDLFDFTREQFTIGNSDFRRPWFGAEVAVRVYERLDFVTDVGWTRSQTASEYQEWEDTGGLPIEQTTTFERTSLRFGLRYFLTERGRTVGQFAWVPSRVSPFIGAGAGVTWHEFRQVGDFVDFDTLDVFSDRLRSAGTGVVSDIRGGAEISLTRRVVLVGEARYEFGKGKTGGDYVGFEDTDLSGFLGSIGISFRF